MLCATLVLTFLVSVLAGDLPSYFPICQRNIPDLDKCLLNAAHTVKPYLRKGIKELNFPPLDPLVIPEIKLEQGTQAISYTVTLRNTTINGMEDFVIKELHLDLKSLQLKGIISFEKISVLTNYDVDGKILVAPIKGRGVLTVTTGPINTTFVINAELVKRKNHEYINPTTIDIKILISSGSGYFDGVINDNEELSKATNRILNENSQELFKEAIPALENVSAELLRNIWSEINSIVPYDKILPLST